MVIFLKERSLGYESERKETLTLEGPTRLGVTGHVFAREYQTNGLAFAAVAVPTGIGIDTGIAVFLCGFFEKAILLGDGFSHPLPNAEIDPLTVPPPVFRL